ncbi:BMC domain-containing protein [Oceanirhabdus sp. W0125-5]|uniref:BMC domain-containing protein n=1 Tax=Oceanirhabdus sp. W0125-5 TaxID=2999116 RepID=UPI0022F2C864|nr:BMC domain-containing protein [Oceanirhabdus sp. W0125-5]WBW94898.1 BMC domain-containing protein [Oceanirhabdus sp. W0125-5]
MSTIGMIELNSIAKGIETADIMVKAAEVDLIMSKPICPGKYLILITGDVGAVNSSLEAGIDNGSQYIVDKLLLPRVHPQLLKAINQSTYIDDVNAVGVLEYYSIATAIVGADAAAKAARIQLIEVRLGVGVGGKGFVTLCGDVSAVSEAIDVGANIGSENGMLVNKVVIPSPTKEVFYKLL